MHGTAPEKGFSGGNNRLYGRRKIGTSFYYVDGVDLEEELIESNEDEWFDQDEVIEVFIERKGKDFYKELERTQDDIMDWGENYEPYP